MLHEKENIAHAEWYDTTAYAEFYAKNNGGNLYVN